VINSIFEQAGTVNLETISYRSYQRNFGRSAQRQASGLFVQRLKRKAESAALTVNELDTRKLRMSQYDHRTQTYTRKPLQQRWHSLGGSDTLVSRDIYSALLACCVKNGEHDPVSIERCWQAVEHQLKSAGFVRDIKLPKGPDRERFLSRLVRDPVFVKILQKNWLGVFLSLKNLSRGFAPTLRYPRIFF